MIKRLALKDLSEWYKKKNRKPLIIRGARQVGKSTLIRMFAKSENIKLIEFNLEVEKKFETYFNSFQVEKIIQDIEFENDILFLSGKKYLIFFDEIQSLPRAIQCLRYFYEKLPHIPIICAGSLLEFALESADFSMPVGRIEHYFIGPIRFSEFLATDQPKLYKVWSEMDFGEALTSVHEKLSQSYQRFILSGGLPESLSYNLEKNLIESEAALRSIIYNYKNDFNKYRNRIPQDRLEKIFEYAGTHLGKKIKYSNISQDLQARDLKSAIHLLAKSQVLSLVHHSACSGIPLATQKNDSVYKFLFLDVGLHILLSGLNSRDLETLLRNEKNETNLLIAGTIHEQFIGQHLLYLNSNIEPELFYWLREGKSNNAEADYVIQVGTHIYPIEVKTGKTGSLKSLTQFVLEKKANKAIKFSSGQPKKTKIEYKEATFQLIHLPHYLVERIRDFV